MCHTLNKLSIQAVAILSSPSLHGIPLAYLCLVLLFPQTEERGIGSKGGRREKSPGGRSPPAGSRAGPGEGRAAAEAGGGARAAGARGGRASAETGAVPGRRATHSGLPLARRGRGHPRWAEETGQWIVRIALSLVCVSFPAF